MNASDDCPSFPYSQVFVRVVDPVPQTFGVKERDPTMFRIYADLFDDKALTSVKDCITYSNILSLLKHGLTRRRGVRV
jgi:hypothetical protein